jgi:hypothetical protein
MDELLRFVDLGGIPDEKQRQALVAEVRRLRAANERISGAWADVIHREQLTRNAHFYDMDELRAERDALRAAIQAATELHFTRGRNILGQPVCNECSPLQPVPCPTIRALAAAAVGDTGQADEPQRPRATTPIPDARASGGSLGSWLADQSRRAADAKFRAGQVVPQQPAWPLCEHGFDDAHELYEDACPGPVGQDTTGEQQ